MGAQETNMMLENVINDVMGDMINDKDASELLEESREESSDMGTVAELNRERED